MKGENQKLSFKLKVESSSKLNTLDSSLVNKTLVESVQLEKTLNIGYSIIQPLNLIFFLNLVQIGSILTARIFSTSVTIVFRRRLH